MKAVVVMLMLIGCVLLEARSNSIPSSHIQNNLRTQREYVSADDTQNDESIAKDKIEKKVIVQKYNKDKDKYEQVNKPFEELPEDRQFKVASKIRDIGYLQRSNKRSDLREDYVFIRRAVFGRPNVAPHMNRDELVNAILKKTGGKRIRFSVLVIPGIVNSAHYAVEVVGPNGNIIDSHSRDERPMEILISYVEKLYRKEIEAEKKHFIKQQFKNIKVGKTMEPIP